MTIFAASEECPLIFTDYPRASPAGFLGLFNNTLQMGEKLRV